MKPWYKPMEINRNLEKRNVPQNNYQNNQHSDFKKKGICFGKLNFLNFC